MFSRQPQQCATAITNVCPHGNIIACQCQGSQEPTHLAVPSLGTALSATLIHALDSFWFIPKWEQNLLMWSDTATRLGAAATA